MEIKNISCNMQTYSIEKEDSNLLKVSIRVMHEGINLKESSFSFDSMEKAKASCKNIPILAYIKRDKDGEAIDFDQHNIIMKIVDTEDGLQLKEYFEEKPIGVIPETNNYRYETIDGVNHVVVDGYIWKSYSNEAYGLIMDSESKSVSMEIAVNDGSIDEHGVYHIKDYTYLGVTVLGDDITPGMGFTCNLTKYSKNVDFNKAIKDIRNEIDIYLERGVKSMSEAKVIEAVEQETPETVENTVVEEIKEVVETEVEVAETEVEVETVENIEQPKEEVFAEEVELENTVQDNTVEQPIEESVEVEEALEAPENVQEIEVEQIIEEEVQQAPECHTEAQNDIQEKIENFARVIIEEMDFSSEEFDLDVVLTKITDKFNKMGEELETLKSFKQKIDEEIFKAEVESVFGKFDFSEEEVGELRTKALNKELSIEELTKELYALEGMKAIKSKKKFSTKEVETARVSIQDIEEKKYKPYGGILD